MFSPCYFYNTDVVTSLSSQNVIWINIPFGFLFSYVFMVKYIQIVIFVVFFCKFDCVFHPVAFDVLGCSYFSCSPNVCQVCSYVWQFANVFIVGRPIINHANFTWFLSVPFCVVTCVIQEETKFVFIRNSKGPLQIKFSIRVWIRVLMSVPFSIDFYPPLKGMIDSHFLWLWKMLNCSWSHFHWFNTSSIYLKLWAFFAMWKNCYDT